LPRGTRRDFGPVDPTMWVVRRAQLGTTASTHTTGDAIYGVADAWGTSANDDDPGPFAGGLSADIVDALEGAAAPDAANVFATMADVGGSPTMVVQAAIAEQNRQGSAPVDFAVASGRVYGGVSLAAAGVVGVGAPVLGFAANAIVVPALGVPPAAVDVYFVYRITDATGANQATNFSTLATFSGAYAGGTFDPDFTGGTAPSISGTDLSVSGGVIVSAAGGLYFVSIDVYVGLD
jgi:hypothetical protein